MYSAGPPTCALVVGAGSIGRRHLRNLRALGITNLAVCDPDSARLRSLAPEIAATFPDMDNALGELRPEIVFVCSPPVYHVRQALEAVRAGAHVFIEKPLSHELEGVDLLISEAGRWGRTVQVGYNLRFHPGVEMLQRLVSEGRIGRILWARAEFGQYLPDWRPQADYRTTYSARRDLGGGIILDASHELDYVLWLMGAPERVLCLAGITSDLAVDVEDCATILLQFPDGAQADVHMDFVQRGYTRTCKLAGEKGTITWDYSANEVRLYLAETGEWQSFAYKFSANDMYLAEAHDFLECVRTGRTPRVTLAEARRVLEVALTARAQFHNVRQECAAHGG